MAEPTLEERLNFKQAKELFLKLSNSNYCEMYFHVDHKCWVVTILGVCK